MNLEQKEILRKKRILEYAEANGNILKTCRRFGERHPGTFPNDFSRFDNLGRPLASIGGNWAVNP